MWSPEDNLISVNELAEVHSDPNVVIFDCRHDLMTPDAGHNMYLQGHIPNSTFASVDDNLADPPGERGRHPLPTRDKFLTTVRSWGVKNDSLIITYDQGVAIFACRLWWMFRWLGHEKVSVLDGGLNAWKSKELPLCTDVCIPSRSTFEAKSPLTRLADADNVLNHNGVLLDGREEDRFQGQNETIDHTAGHIPGAICRPSNFNLDSSLKFTRDASPFDMVTDNTDVICYCGSGIKATHNILALVVSGHKEPALYPGSWSEWIEDPSRPIVTG